MRLQTAPSRSPRIANRTPVFDARVGLPLFGAKKAGCEARPSRLAGMTALDFVN
jgi:hypothetical protein